MINPWGVTGKLCSSVLAWDSEAEVPTGGCECDLRPRPTGSGCWWAAESL